MKTADEYAELAEQTLDANGGYTWTEVVMAKANVYATLALAAATKEAASAGKPAALPSQFGFVPKPVQAPLGERYAEPHTGGAQPTSRERS